MRTAILIAATIFSTAAFAQSSAPQLIEIDDDQTNVAVLGLTVDQIEDMDLFDGQGTKLGDVEEVLGTDPASATALAVDLKGTDDIDVIVELAGLEVQGNQIITTMSADELRGLPVWND